MKRISLLLLFIFLLTGCNQRLVVNTGTPHNADTGLYKNSKTYTAVIYADDLGGSGDPVYATNDGLTGGYYVSSWSTLHDQADGNLYDSSDIRTEASYNNSRYNIYRSFLTFDTSFLGSNAVISSAVISLYGESIGGYNAGYIASGIYGCSDYGSFSETAYSKGNTTLQSDTVYSINDPSYSTWSIVGYNNFVLNSVGVNNINKTGSSHYSFRNVNKDVANVAPVQVYQNFMTAFSSAYTGTTRDPKLTITYTIVEPPPSSGQIIIIE